MSVYVQSATLYTYICTYGTGNSPCQAVYSLQRTCIIQADTCAMPSEGRIPLPSLFALPLPSNVLPFPPVGLGAGLVTK